MQRKKLCQDTFYIVPCVRRDKHNELEASLLPPQRLAAADSL